MATLHFPPAAGLLTPSPTRTTRRSSSPQIAPAPPPGPKLRDSCHACASSKVKCHKEKPACSRCTKRGLTCEYVATKRVGRKHDRTASSITSEASNKSKLSNGVGNSKQQSPPTTASISVAQSALPPASPWFTPHSTADFLPALASLQPSPRPTSSNNPSGASLFPGALSPVDPLHSVITGIPNDLDDFFASPISFPGHDTDSDLLGQPEFYAGIDGGPTLLEGFTPFEKSVADLQSIANPHSPPNSRASPAPQIAPSALHNNCNNNSIHGDSFQNFQQQTTPPRLNTDVPCTCLVQALGLMQQLFPNASSSACSSLGSSLVSTPQAQEQFSTAANLPTIQTVIAKNEQTIKAVSQMLQCSCSQDGYLLAIMSLIVFKVLGWYGAAARQGPSSSSSGPSSSAATPTNMMNMINGMDNDGSNNYPGTRSGTQSPRPGPYHHSPHGSLAGGEQVQALQGPAVVGSYCLEGEDSARMAGQLVLSELHRVQRLVNQLSARLKLQAARAGGFGAASLVATPSSNSDGSIGGFFGGGGGVSDSPLASPFSALMLDQMGSDLKRRLKALSLEIVEGLRRD